MVDWNAEAFGTTGPAKIDWNAEAFPAHTETPPAVFTTPGGQQRLFPAGVDTSREWRETEHAKETISGGEIVQAPRVGPVQTAKTTRESFSIPAEAKMTAQGTASFLESKFGRGSVYLDDQDRIFVLTPEERKKPLKDQRPVIFNRPGLSKADIALAPLMVSGAATGALVAPAAAAAASQAVPALAAGKLGAAAGSLAAGGGILAAGGGAGAVARQGLAAALPGEETLTPGQRAADIGINAALEVAAPGAAKVAGKLVSGAARVARGPGRWASDLLEKVIYRSAPETVAEGAELSGRANMDFSAAQLAQSKGWLQLQGYLQTQPLVGGVFNEQAQIQHGRLKELGEEVVSSLGATGVTPLEATKSLVSQYSTKVKNLVAAGERVLGSLGKEGREDAAVGALRAFKAETDSLAKTRSDTASVLFGRVKQLSGNREIFPVEKTIEEIDKLSSEMKSRLSSDAARNTVDFLAGVRSRLLASTEASTPRRMAGFISQEPPPSKTVTRPMITAQEFMNALSDWGRKSVDPRDVIEKVTDRNLGYMVATRVFKALQSDLDDAANAAGTEAPIAKAIKEARDTYKKMSEPLNAIAENPLSAFIESPEKFATSLLKGDRSAENRAAMKLLDDIAPPRADAMRAAVTRDALAGVKEIDGVAEPKSMAAAIRKSMPQLEVVYEGKPKALADLRKIAAAAERLGNNPLAKFVGKDEKLLEEFTKKANNADLKDLMRYIGAVSPKRADRLTGAFIQTLIDKAGPSATQGTEDVLNPATLVRAVEPNRGALGVALAGKPEALGAVDDMVASARRVANMAGSGVSPTQHRQAIARMIELAIGSVGTAGIAVGVSQGDLGTAAGGLAVPLAAVFASRWVARSMANPKIAKAYAQAYRAAANPNRMQVDKAFQQSTKQALLDIMTWANRVQTQGQEDATASAAQ